MIVFISTSADFEPRDFVAIEPSNDLNRRKPHADGPGTHNHKTRSVSASVIQNPSCGPNFRDL
jgi:hypothetical protein